MGYRLVFINKTSATKTEMQETIKNNPCIPYIFTIGSKRSGEENWPKKKLEVSNPDAFPLLLGGT